MKGGKCAFCGELKQLEREHVLSESVWRQFDDVAPTTFDRKREKFHGADLTVKDVCGTCNNERLSPLDEEATLFSRNYLTEPLSAGDSLTFDSKKMERWLMKTTANFHRQNGMEDDWWTEYRSYILEGNGREESVISFFGAWPEWNALEQFGRIKTIDWGECGLGGFERFSACELENNIAEAWSLKVGYGVFLLALSEGSDGFRSKIKETLRNYHWLDLREDEEISGLAFGPSSSITVIGPPSKVPGR